MWSLSLIALPSLLVSSVLAQDGSECQPYSEPDIISHLSEFPKAWDPAHILPTDSAGQDKWNSIKDSVPNLPPKARTFQLSSQVQSRTLNKKFL
ncbi:hypothetical protein PM082_002187 [Marasmius tenuissimus]|nr:hypothetical protein PM082_002187 [Marasmius tenuissimus]